MTTETPIALALATSIKRWVAGTVGWFTVAQVNDGVGINPKGPNRGNRDVILSRLVAAGTLKRHPSQHGIYRLVDNKAPVLDWKDADPNKVLDITWPFGLEQYVKFFRKNIAVVAGAPDSGKTAFMLDFCIKNMNKYPTIYFSSEMGAEEFRSRVVKTGVDINDWTAEVRERSANFEDAVDPDAINIIDYLEITQDFSDVGTVIRGIYDRLKDGIAVIALQKKRDTTFNKQRVEYDLGRGAEFSLEKARLYLAMDTYTSDTERGHVIRIVKAKNRVNSAINPVGIKWKFRLLDGCQFTNIERADAFLDK